MSKGLSFIEPQLPILVDHPPEGGQWTHEVKYDGFRSQIIIDRGIVRIYTRNGYDWTKKYEFIAHTAATLPTKSAIIDGEMVATDAEGKTNIRDFRTALENHPQSLAFIAFDLLHLDGKDLRHRTLEERRTLLWNLVQPGHGTIQYSHHVDSDGAAFFAAAEGMRLEGIVSKLRDSKYRSGWSKAWLKTKSYAEAEFLIAGVRRVPGEAPLAMMTADSGEYVGSAFVALPGNVRDAFYEHTEAGGGVTPKGAKARAIWSKPGLVGMVKFLRGEDHLRHATLKAVKPVHPKVALNRQLEQREAVRELLDHLKTNEVRRLPWRKS